MKQQNAITITQDELLKALFETVYKRRNLCASHVVHGIAAGTFKLLQKPRKCTKNNPYTVDKNNPLARWTHVDANEVHDSQESHQYGGDTVRFRCPYCGIEWTEELPQ